VSGAHALVFGASDLGGWAVVDQLLHNYPAKDTFSKVTALVNRQLDVSESYWPSHSSVALDLLSNVNLAERTVEEFTALLKRKVEDMRTSHTFTTSVGSLKSQFFMSTPMCLR
jgi:hypothetical protein